MTTQLFNKLSVDIQDTIAFELRAQYYDGYSKAEIWNTPS